MNSSFALMVLFAGVVSTLIVCLWEMVIYPKPRDNDINANSSMKNLVSYVGQVFVQDIFISLLILSIHYSSAIEAYKIALIVWVTFYCVPLLSKSFIHNLGNSITIWQNSAFSYVLFGRLLSLLSISAIYSYFI